eukprot:TRINITY_DN1115_c0_g1_i2.p1 TRINITY_DN1115_c0_g1~~TRINITY_DN1115_c0_g1_i2.p1  ORF type:complete len:358 (+),score=119.45 TRINITY_DN1115_c0_g1_i2:107-1180(+)
MVVVRSLSLSLSPFTTAPFISLEEQTNHLLWPSSQPSHASAVCGSFVQKDGCSEISLSLSLSVHDRALHKPPRPAPLVSLFSNPLSSSYSTHAPNGHTTNQHNNQQQQHKTKKRNFEKMMMTPMIPSGKDLRYYAFGSPSPSNSNNTNTTTAALSPSDTLPQLRLDQFFSASSSQLHDVLHSQRQQQQQLPHFLPEDEEVRRPLTPPASSNDLAILCAAGDLLSFKANRRHSCSTIPSFLEEVPSPSSISSSPPSSPRSPSSPSSASCLSPRNPVKKTAQSITKKRRRVRAEMPEDVFCRHCKTTQTPEWRRGPDGRKSLCNACGLFFSEMMRKEEQLTSGSEDIMKAKMDFAFLLS